MENKEKIKSVGDQGTVSVRYVDHVAGDEFTRQKRQRALQELAATIPDDVEFYVGIDQVLSHRGEGKATILEPGSSFDLQDAGRTDLTPSERLRYLLRRGLIHQNSRYQAPKSGADQDGAK